MSFENDTGMQFLLFEGLSRDSPRGPPTTQLVSCNVTVICARSASASVLIAAFIATGFGLASRLVDGLVLTSGKHLYEMVNQKWNVLAPFARRWQRHGKYIEPIIEIGAE